MFEKSIQKYPPLTWIIPRLQELGFRIKDVRVRKCEVTVIAEREVMDIPSTQKLTLKIRRYNDPAKTDRVKLVIENWDSTFNEDYVEPPSNLDDYALSEKFEEWLHERFGKKLEELSEEEYEELTTKFSDELEAEFRHELDEFYRKWDGRVIRFKIGQRVRGRVVYRVEEYGYENVRYFAVGDLVIETDIVGLQVVLDIYDQLPLIITD